MILMILIGVYRDTRVLPGGVHRLRAGKRAGFSCGPTFSRSGISERFVNYGKLNVCR